MSHQDIINSIANDEMPDYQEDDYDEHAIYEGVDEGTNVGEVEPDEMKRRVEEMEEELDKLSKIQQQVERQISIAADSVDEKSIYVGQVDYEATPEELRAHFAPCGTINRITIMCDKITGHPKGFAYIEFVDKESVDNALKLDESVFRSRQLKVLPKRQNIPVSVLRGSRGRGRGRISGFRGSPSGRFTGRTGGRFSSARGRGGFIRGGRGRAGFYNSYY